MLLRTVSLCFFILFTVNLAAQFEQDYVPLRFEGKIPIEFLNSTEEGTVVKRKRKSKSRRKMSRRREREFNTINNYVLKQSLQSGAILFNDELSAYVQEVADRALIGDPKLKEKVKVYATRFVNPNASSWKDGTIYLNVGLLAKLRSEAQLAFVICHEAAHVAKRHVLRGYQKKQEIEKKSKRKISFSKMDRMVDNEDLINLFRYRKKYEFEADEEGFEIFSRSEYNHEAALEAMDVLRIINARSRDTFGLSQISGVKVNTSIDSAWIDKKFSAVGFTGPYDYELKEIMSEESDESEDDEELSTHPSVYERKAALSTQISESEVTNGGRDFLLKAKRFEYFRTLAAFENVERLFYGNSYGYSLYAALELADRFPHNQYLHEIIGRSLYWLAHYDHLESLENILPEAGWEGLSPSFNHLNSFVLRLAEEDKLAELAKQYSTFYRGIFPENDVFAFLSLRAAELQGETVDYDEFVTKFPNSRFAAYASQTNLKP